MILAGLRVDAGEPAGPDCTAWGLTSCPRPYDARIPDPKDMLTWTQPERVIGFRNTFRMYGADAFHVGAGRAYPLPRHDARCLRSTTASAGAATASRITCGVNR